METRKASLENSDKTPSTNIINNSLQENKPKAFALRKSYYRPEPHVWTEDEKQQFAENAKHIVYGDHNLRYIEGGWFYLPKDHPEYQEHPSGSYVINQIGPCILQFDIDMLYCNVIEHTLLALAGVEEMPLERCVFYDPAKHGKTILAQLDELERKKVEESSIFFQIPLSNENSMELLRQFAVKKGIEFNDYTRTLSEEDKQSNIKLIRFNAESVYHTLFPEIMNYLRSHPDDVKRHRKVMYERLSVKNQESNGSYSWGRLFNKRTALAALTVTVAAAVAAKTLANRR